MDPGASELSGSLGRMQGAMLMASSNDPLTTHPLLSPPPSSSDTFPPSSHGTGAAPSPPRYVPYTPRQRPYTTTTSATISSSMATVSPSSIHGGATGKLQLQSLKAAVQTMGLDNSSVGWVILEKLVSGEVEGPEWDAIWNAIANCQTSLLLPTEKASSSLVITPEFVREHVAFSVGPIKESSSLVTLGGLRGTIDEHSVVFRTAMSTTSEIFHSIQRTSSRVSAFTTLPPLPIGEDPNVPYPAYQVSDQIASLHIPPRPIPTSPPPLPPRPTPAAAPGLSGRFASLFGGKASPVVPPARPTSPQPPPSIRSEASVESAHSGASPYSSDGHSVTAFAIDRKIIRKDVGKAVSKALKADIKSRLSSLPSWVADRILKFTVPLQPLSKKGKNDPGSSSDPPSPVVSRSGSGRDHDVVDTSGAQEMGDSFQNLYESIEDDLRKGWSGSTPKRRSVDDLEKAEREKAPEEPSSADTLEERVEEAMEQVESCIAAVFYDQLFLPSGSDDASHDEALANRIAALNMLDLGWEHLGVEMDASGAETKGIDIVVAACGKELQKLQNPAYRSPQAKAGVLVGVHKVVVDGLSRLPPVRLKPDGEHEEPTLDTKTPRQETFSVNKPTALSPLTVDSPKSMLTPESVSSALPKVRSPSLLGSPRTHQSSLRSLSPTGEASSPAQSSLLLPEEPDVAPHTVVAKPTEVNTDVLLPIIIFAVVKANPVQLVSQLLFIQRYRSRHVGGEESFCLINFLAVVEFLEHVDMQALGLGDADRVMSTHYLSPLPLPAAAGSPTSPVTVTGRLRGRVEQQVGEFATGATKVISGVGGVVDSSFSALRGLLNTGDQHGEDGKNNSPAAVVSAMITRPGFGLLRRGTSFSIAGVAANIPGVSTPRGAKGGTEEGRQMIEVPSRPGSVRRMNDDDDTSDRSGGETSDDEEGSTSEAEPYNGEGDEDEDTHHEGSVFRDKSDTRSIRSFSSMMSRDPGEDKRERPSLTDRLANMPALSRLAGHSHDKTGTPPGSRRTSLLPPPRHDGPPPSITSPTMERIAPPNPRFLQSTADELRISEVPALLAEYRRVVEALRSMGGFQE